MQTPQEPEYPGAVELAKALAVPPERLRRTCDPSVFPFDSTEEFEPLAGTVGQERAVSAIEFGVEIQDGGFNLFVTGPTGSGRSTTVRGYLEQAACNRPVPEDWVYVHNFADPYRPKAIRLKAGEGATFARRMDELVVALLREIPRAFEGESYERRKNHIIARLQQRQQALLERVKEDARAHGFAIEMAASGITSVPLVNGQPLAAEEYERLPKDTREEMERRGKEVREHVEQMVRQGRKLEKETIERLRQLDHDVAFFAMGHLFEDLLHAYQDHPEVPAYLKQVQEDIPQHLDDFRGGKPEGQPTAPPEAPPMSREDQLARYKVNVFVENSGLCGAPVIEEYNPNYYNLMGRIEYQSRFGSMTTDFRQIKAGAIHRANGGYLLLEAADLLSGPMVWDALKKALQSKEARIENIGEQMSPIPATTLKPEPIPLRIKVVLVGNSSIYYLLFAQDEDFHKLFKVKADFGPDMARSDQNVLGYAGFITRQVREKGLLPFDRSGLARVVEQGSRLVEDQTRLTTRFSQIVDLLVEASFWAGKNGHRLVMAEDVDRAIAHKEYRSNLVAERVQAMIEDGTVMIDVDGEARGQVNGLAIADLGDYSFGSPSRITARTSAGNSGVVNIEREIKLSGPIHSKGVLVLAGYLAGKYALGYPLALSATLTFEQLYNEVDGDSASSTELYALLSALSGLPLKQGMAVTGSVNQHGQIQAVGGVTRKVEGFFEVCRAKGLTGEQGVIVPATNVKHLMLKDEVIQAVREGLFHLWAIRTVDEGIELLTGVSAGTVHHGVDARLREYATLQKEFAAGLRG